MKEEIHIILERAKDFLKDAEVLYEEERYDAVPNRAYYCLFTAVRALLFSQNTFAKTHSGAHAKFRELFIKTGKLPPLLSQVLTELFDLRQQVDYDFEVDIEKEVAKEIIENADHFLEETIRFLSE